MKNKRIKKTVSIFLASLFTLTLIPACTEKTSAISVDSLKDYTIVYPEEYAKISEYRMDIVNELSDAIRLVTGTEIKALPDTEAVGGKKIILASGKTETAYSEKIEGFNSAMDYVVAVDGENIVLGGKNYYSDMRAVYCFMNEYLGYDDIEGKLVDNKKPISGEYENIYVEPVTRLCAATWATSFSEAYQIKDMADCNFNMTILQAPYMSKDEVINNIKWCTRYGIEVLINNIPSSTMPYAELYYDCPMIYGGYVWDEPYYEEHIENANRNYTEFLEKYSEYGWEPYINFGGYSFLLDEINSEFPELNVVSFDNYIFVSNQNQYSFTSGEGSNYLGILQKHQQEAEKRGVPFWMFIQAHGGEGRFFNASKGYRYQLYLNLCFGLDNSMYFEYANENEILDWMDTSDLVVNTKFKKTRNYEYAKQANAEYLQFKEILQDYTSLGNLTYFVRREEIRLYDGTDKSKTAIQNYADFDEYDGFGNVLEDVVKPDGRYDSFFVGAFEKTNGNGYAFVFMNLDIPDNTTYGEEDIPVGDGKNVFKTAWDSDSLIMEKADEPIKLKINGSKVTCYRDGIPSVLCVDEDGYYNVYCGNGVCLFFVVE